MKLPMKQNVFSVNPSVKLVPTPLIIVTLVPQTEETKSQNAHAHMDNMLMKKMFAKIVITHAKLVKEHLTAVLNVVILLEYQSQNVNVHQAIMMLDMQLVKHVYQNVTNVLFLTTNVQYVMNQESYHQNQIAHAQMDNTNSNITVMIVILNV
jgi:hypothetical protein